MAVLLNLADDNVRAIVEHAKATGVVTAEEFNVILGTGDVAPDDIEDTLVALAAMGIAYSDGLTEEQHDKAVYDGLSDWAAKGGTAPQLTGDAWLSFLREAERRKPKG